MVLCAEANSSEGHHHEQRPDQDGTKVVREFTIPRTSLSDQPNGVQRLFYFVDQGIGGVQKACHANHSQDPDFQIVDKADDGRREFLPLSSREVRVLEQELAQFPGVPQTPLGRIPSRQERALVRGGLYKPDRQPGHRASGGGIP